MAPSGARCACLGTAEPIHGDWPLGESVSDAPASFDIVGDDIRGEFLGELLLGLELPYPSVLGGPSSVERLPGTSLPLLERGLMRHLWVKCRSGVGESLFDPSIEPGEPCADDAADLPSKTRVDMARVLLAESTESCACAAS